MSANKENLKRPLNGPNGLSACSVSAVAFKDSSAPFRSTVSFSCCFLRTCVIFFTVAQFPEHWTEEAHDATNSHFGHRFLRCPLHSHPRLSSRALLIDNDHLSLRSPNSADLPESTLGLRPSLSHCFRLSFPLSISLRPNFLHIFFAISFLYCLYFSCAYERCV